MPTYCIKHVLPDGTLAGYHGDSCCSVTTDKSRAKTIVASSETEPTKWLGVVRKNFEYIWNHDSAGPEYRGYACWKGNPLSQIRTEVELFDTRDLRFPIVLHIMN